jgi:hypothetical protein
MSLKIVEFFGAIPGEAGWKTAAQKGDCPFVGGVCRKQLHDGTPSGVCTLAATQNPAPVICCPYRLYADDYAVLARIAREVFGQTAVLNLGRKGTPAGSLSVRVFGKDQGKELRLPSRNRAGAYSVDWILALVDKHEQLLEFVAVEIQTIDTTGNYKQQREDLAAGNANPERSGAGFNWENVNKRILPQLIYKGHVLRREALCKKGLYFVTPTPVCERVRTRLGDKMMTYQPHPGSVTFHSYSLNMEVETKPRPLVFDGAFTTTIDQLVVAFSSPTNLPEAGVYEEAIRKALADSAR